MSRCPRVQTPRSFVEQIFRIRGIGLCLVYGSRSAAWMPRDVCESRNEYMTEFCNEASKNTTDYVMNCCRKAVCGFTQKDRIAINYIALQYVIMFSL